LKSKEKLRQTTTPEPELSSAPHYERAIYETLLRIEELLRSVAGAGAATSASSVGGPATFTVTEAAKALGVGRSTVYELARRNELPAIRLGRRLLIPRHAVEVYLDTLGKTNLSR
jgi:excisionase family DNA binding protein